MKRFRAGKKKHIFLSAAPFSFLLLWIQKAYLKLKLPICNHSEKYVNKSHHARDSMMKDRSLRRLIHIQVFSIHTSSIQILPPTNSIPKTIWLCSQPADISMMYLNCYSLHPKLPFRWLIPPIKNIYAFWVHS